MISLRLEWIYNLAKKRPGGITRIVDSWPGGAFDRITFYRWFKQYHSVPPEQILFLAGALNLDPLALYDINPVTYRRLCLRLLRGAFSTKNDPILKSIGWINDLIAPSKEWPPAQFMRHYSNRNAGWICRDFSHSAREKVGYFQKLQFSVHRSGFVEPQVWHFAFRSPGFEEKFWRPYGFAIREGEHLALYQLRGGSSLATIPPETDSFVIETWFGPGAAEFRVASLHDFEFSLITVSNSPTLRFPES